LFNIGCDVDGSLKELATLIVTEVGYKGKFVFDLAKPDG
jgi:hypothetical protein